MSLAPFNLGWSVKQMVVKPQCPPLPDPVPLLIWDSGQNVANGVEYTLDSADDGSINISEITWWEMREGVSLLGAGGATMATTAWTPGAPDVGNHTVDVWWYYAPTCYVVDSSSFVLQVT